MKRLIAAGVLVAAASVGLPAHAVLAGAAEPTVPSALAIPDGNKLFRVGHAVGVQIYSCSAAPGGGTWTFVAPRADVYDNHGKLIMTHFAGPTWQARDGSYVVGRKDAGVSVDPTAVDWLKLSATATSVGPDGDQLAHTTFVQRLNTSGGIAPPASTCDSGTTGTLAAVPYTADYYFWKSAGE